MNNIALVEINRTLAFYGGTFVNEPGWSRLTESPSLNEKLIP